MQSLTVSTAAVAGAAHYASLFNSSKKNSCKENSRTKLSWLGSAENELPVLSGSSRGRGLKSSDGKRSNTLQVQASIIDVMDPFNIIHKDDTIELKGTALISKKTFLDFDNAATTIIDNTTDLIFQQKVDMQLVSVDLDKQGKPKLSETSSISRWTFSDFNPLAGEEKYTINFKIPKDFGEVGAFIVRNNHQNEFYIHSLSLTVPNKNSIEFTCNSWVYPDKEVGFLHIEDHEDRVFFANKQYLPNQTPEGLKKYREQELIALQGNGKGERTLKDRIYDYDVYNDLGTKNDVRATLGGSSKLPYPRRCRTGREQMKNKAGETIEKPVGPSLTSLLDFYVPADEFFGAQKTSGFLAGGLKGVAHGLLPILQGTIQDKLPLFGTPHFDTYKDIKNLLANGLDLKDHQKNSPLVLLETIFNAEGQNRNVLKFPLPQVIGTDDMAWSTDEELGRQTLAGLNPVTIERVQIFPPKSTLDPKTYGKATALTEEHIEPYLEGLSVDQAIQSKRLFIVDYHDAYMPFINKINDLEKTEKAKKNKAYAVRAIFFLNGKGAMMPVAIECSLPPKDGSPGSNRVFTPPQGGAKDVLWDLARAHFNAIDFSYHEIISHWLRTHAVMEPFIIATRRQLSALHPVYQLLYPVFKNTIMINAAARFSLINAGGVFEGQFINSTCSIEMSSTVYGNSWRFDKQALPADLVNRGMAEPADASQPGGVKLVVEDYPFAKDGLELWAVMKEWIRQYVLVVYEGSDQAIRSDTELQNWWNEIRNVGHGDMKEGWIPCDSVENLTEILAIIHWIGGPHHAAVNFGQYAYAGFMPNKPAQCIKLIPEKGTKEYDEAVKNPELAVLKTVSPQAVAVTTLVTLELLSTHGVDEEYIGKRNPSWTSNEEVRKRFAWYSDKIKELEHRFTQRNQDPSLINRNGPAKVPYTLLVPSSMSGLTGKGVPNSISI